MCIRTRIHIHTCTLHTDVYTYMYIYTYMHIYVRIYVYTCICTYRLHSLYLGDQRVFSAHSPERLLQVCRDRDVSGLCVGA